NFFARDAAPQRRRQRGRGTGGLRLTTDGLNEVLRPVQQNRSVLQERPTAAHLRGADELPPADEHFALDGHREAGSRAVERGGRRWRAAQSERRTRAQRPERG